jgi:hypothetical protein
VDFKHSIKAPVVTGTQDNVNVWSSKEDCDTNDRNEDISVRFLLRGSSKPRARVFKAGVFKHLRKVTGTISIVASRTHVPPRFNE